VKARALAAALIAAATLAAPTARAEGDYAISPEGHPFRVRFDPASRIRLGVGGSAARAADGRISPTLELAAGIGYRSLHASGKDPVRVVWQVDQRFVSGWVAPLVRPFGGAPALDAALYGLAAHRHDDSPRIVLPSSPPIGVPFPFDVGVEGEVGRVWVPRALPQAAGRPEVPFVRVGVVRATGFVDPWRSGVPGRSLEIGAGVRYDLDMHGSPASGNARARLVPARVVHRVAPMTAASVRFRYQTQNGLLALDVRGDVIPHWTSEGKWAVAGMGHAHLERTLLAVNDQPIAAVFEGGYRFVPPALGDAEMHDVRVHLGVTFGIDLSGSRGTIGPSTARRFP
jgi:hypothetical protein